MKGLDQSIGFFPKIAKERPRCPFITDLYRVVGNWWYKRTGGDSTRKKKSKI